MKVNQYVDAFPVAGSAEDLVKALADVVDRKLGSKTNKEYCYQNFSFYITIIKLCILNLLGYSYASGTVFIDYIYGFMDYIYCLKPWSV